MVRHIIAVLFAASALSVEANWRPNEKLLAAVRQIESSNGLMQHGDNGRSLGQFQLSEAAWMDVSAWRKTRGLKTYSYDQHVFHYTISKAYAADYLALLRGELIKKLKRQPSVAEIYAAYNMGLGTFAECDYKLSRVNPTTKKKAHQVQALASRS
ncbi:MAG TPA: hypothetical protein VEH27_01325 [Methylomirabilota bacterium]|nr:hypothetical protein [Methylomirabilota bacterium]